MRLRSIVLPFLAVALATASLPAQTDLAGRIDGNQYVSPAGAYRITIPVLPELGGRIVDTPEVVTFEDDFNVHASLACFKMDATQRWEYETRGRRDYLIWFFTNFVQRDFQQRFPQSRVESAKFIPGMEEGTLLTYNLLPGGTMFANRPSFSETEEVFVAKRGNLLFLREGHVYVLSMELAERALERRTYAKTTEEEDELLRRRLLELYGRITFATPSAASATAAPKGP